MADRIRIRPIMVHPSQRSAHYAAREPSWRLTYRRGDTTRSYRVRPFLLGSAAGVFVLLLAAYVGATAYLVYRDDLLSAAVSRQVTLQYAYEERIAALRSELDRLSSRHAVQTEGVEQQLAALLEQQAVIERRQSTLDDLVDLARDAGVAVALARVGSSLDRTESRQSDALDSLSAAAEGESDRLTEILAPVGASVGGPADGADGPEGGPYIPARGLHFVERAALLQRTLDDIATLRTNARALPLGVPVKALYLSSRYGNRVDPFLKRLAFHAGLDFVAESGTIVRATAAGTILSAGPNAGYGEMVEIAHADGMTTRYGHLSAILVRPGMHVEPGTAIGAVGSTGRSTGPHLHYETRRDGEPVDPARYLAAGRALRAGS